MPQSLPPPPPVAEIERRIRWPAGAALAFIAVLAVLLLVAVLPIVAPPGVLEGLPDDAEVRAAAARVRGMEPVPGSQLAFGSALFGTESLEVGSLAATPPPADAGAPLARDVAALRGAGATLERARRRMRGDPRVRVFLAHLAFAEAERMSLAGDARRAARLSAIAEREYRAVTAGRDEVPEARMGLGLLFGWRASRERDAWQRRGLELRALAQFTAVRPSERTYPAALYDRALLLDRVGRSAEARRCAGEYLARDGTGARAERLRAQGLGW